MKVVAATDVDFEPQDQIAMLIAEVGKGDESAFRELYELTADWVYGVTLRVLRDPSQSEEVAQEVLLEIWRTAARYDRTKGSGKAWIMTLAHRRAVDRVRSAQSGRDREQKVFDQSYEPEIDTVADTVETRLEQERVRRYLAELTDSQREAISLAYFKGYSQREVAQALDVPLGTVKTRMRDGLIRMRDAMGAAS
ncbi:MAG: ECF RNA polymerase sigma factor SigK [Actinomycetia bacterium]|nr:ECF RNA polymerase sigma factor SigK [Actinomycetes bacterium]